MLCMTCDHRAFDHSDNRQDGCALCECVLTELDVYADNAWRLAEERDAFRREAEHLFSLLCEERASVKEAGLAILEGIDGEYCDEDTGPRLRTFLDRVAAGYFADK